jgi:hypothetical protein
VRVADPFLSQECVGVRVNNPLPFRGYANKSYKITVIKKGGLDARLFLSRFLSGFMSRRTNRIVLKE